MANIHSPNITRWLEYGHRGLSSESIVSHLTGVPIGGRECAPYDPSDFRRCQMLLNQVPELRQELHRMAEVSPEWAALVERWDDIDDLMNAERESGNRAPKTYALMKSLRASTNRGEVA